MGPLPPPRRERATLERQLVQIAETVRARPGIRQAVMLRDVLGRESSAVTRHAEARGVIVRTVSPDDARQACLWAPDAVPAGARLFATRPRE